MFEFDFLKLKSIENGQIPSKKVNIIKFFDRFGTFSKDFDFFVCLTLFDILVRFYSKIDRFNQILLKIKD